MFRIRGLLFSNFLPRKDDKKQPGETTSGPSPTRVVGRSNRQRSDRVLGEAGIERVGGSNGGKK
jgi:hypothetical protein